MRRLRRALLPLVILLAVMGIHYVWLGVFPEQDPAQDRWAATPVVKNSWWDGYVSTQSYWLGLSYSMSLAFAAVALRRYREQRSCGSKRFAIGSVTFSGVLTVVACYLVGCCGSPMLVVYLNLFGAKFLPFAKPLVALLTGVSLTVAWWWLTCRSPAGPADDERARLARSCC